MSFTGKDQAYLDAQIDNDPFFPSLVLGDFQRIFRVPADQAQEAVEHQLCIARNRINLDLAEFREAWVSEGYETLSQYDEENATDKSTYYLDAVFSRAKAQLLRDYQTFSRTEHARDIATESDDMNQMLLARSRKSLRMVQGVGGSLSVALL